MTALTPVELDRLSGLPPAPPPEGAPTLERLAEQGTFWILAEGEADLFLQALPPDGPEGDRHHLGTFRSGQALGGLRIPGEPRDLRLVVVPGPGCRILAGRWDQLEGPLRARVREAFTEAALGALAASLAPAAPPRVLTLLAPGAAVDLEPGDCASVREPLGWVQVLEGELALRGESPLDAAPEQGLPLARGLWVQAGETGARVRGIPSPGADGGGPGDPVLPALVGLLVRDQERAAAARLERMRQGSATERRERGKTLAALARIGAGGGQGPDLPGGDGGVLDACRLLGGACGITFLAPPSWVLEEGGQAPLEAICRASRVRLRRVTLAEAWWKRDAGPLLGFLGPGRAPVALLPRAGGAGGYRLTDPAGGPPLDLDSALAARLDPLAYTFYRPGVAGKIGLRELFLMVWRELQGDFRRMLVVSLGSGLLGLMLPVALRLMTDQVIPSADVPSVKVVVLALAALAGGSALFNLARGLALLRIEVRVGGSLQAAVVDRLLRLPVGFFKRFPVGDLLSRASAVDAIQGRLSGVTLTTVLSASFSLLNFGLLLYYNASLTLVAVGLVAATALTNGVVGRFAVRLERKRQDAAGAMSGETLQLLSGVAKLKVAAAEGRAFTHWCRSLLAERLLAVRGNNLALAMGVCNDTLLVLSSLVLFAAVGAQLNTPGNGFSPGSFIAFNSAFGSFCSATISLIGTAVGLLDIGPTLDRARPILEELPEDLAALPDPGRLLGQVEAQHLEFRYQPDGPLILQDVSFLARPGAFIALAGPSGGGKSTVMRLLLGFERPEAGGIFYDSRDLQGVNLTGLRAQLGVVLQGSRLQPGSIYQNIVGSGLYSMDEAWEAAEAAGMADDIRAMPMGMHTVVSEGAGTLSGGQRQRLIIASALVRRPRIMLFDEATSALDNHTQDIVSRSLERLNATRIVIAHRLSTIRNADRIYVLDRGRVVQEGSFGELEQREGLFRRLAERQLA